MMYALNAKGLVHRLVRSSLVLFVVAGPRSSEKERPDSPKSLPARIAGAAMSAGMFGVWANRNGISERTNQAERRPQVAVVSAAG